jgi:hypothetical protein
MGYWGFVLLVVALIGGAVALGRLIRHTDRNDDGTHGGGDPAATW